MEFIVKTWQYDYKDWSQKQLDELELSELFLRAMTNERSSFVWDNQLDKLEFGGIQMNEQIKEYIDKYPSDIIAMYNDLRNLIFDSISSEPQETMWAKLPTYYVGESFVRLIPFKDHINIEAKAVSQNTEMLLGYKVTPKGMLQIFLKQDIPADVLKKIFVETLG